MLVHGFTGPDQTDRPAWAWDWLPSDSNIPDNTFIPHKYSPSDLLSGNFVADAIEREARKLLEVIGSNTAPKGNIPIPQRLNDKKPITDVRNQNPIFISLITCSPPEYSGD